MNNLLTALIIVLALISGACAGAEPADVKTLKEWSFDIPEAASEWTPNGSVMGLAMRDGCLTGQSTGPDPLINGPSFDILASPFQFVEIRMRTTVTGLGQLYWTNTTEPPHDGFRPEKVRQFTVEKGDFRVYRLFLYWQDEGNIIRLRIDPPDNAEFAIDYVRIRELEVPASKQAFFDFTKPAESWTVTEGVQPPVSSQGITLAGPGDRCLVSPALSLDAEAFPWFAVRARTTRADRLTIQWISDDAPGLRSHSIPLKRDGKWHVYNVPMEQLTDWIGKIGMLGLAVTLPNKGKMEIQYAGTGTRPGGPAELEIRYFGFVDSINRAGKPAVAQALVANVGGETAHDIKAILPTPESLVIESGTQSAPVLRPGESKLLTWTVRPSKPGLYPARLIVSAKGLDPANASADLLVHPPVQVAHTGYVPAPKPVRGDIEVGMYYFPGWNGYSRWAVLNDFPERRPVLGYYREGDPEVADWHIKWMVEHGVTFIVYDWYWSSGGRSLEHALHDGFFNARYRDKIKFCLLWANHNPPKTSSAEDMVNVTRYWLDNYFLRPEYFMVDGKPVVVIFSPYRLTDDMGVEGVKQAFDKSREMAREKGLKGIYFVACAGPSRSQLETLEKEGYDAVTGYNYPGAGDKGRNVAPYDDMVTGYLDIWNAIADNTRLRYIPVNEPGWDSRPWHGPDARQRTGKTPGKFRKMLENARQFVKTRDPGPAPGMVLIEAWNEFGEGDYTEPHQEFGFGHVDAIREVFTSAPTTHEDVVPQDVGLGPYEVVKPEPVTHWEFDDPRNPGWDASQNLVDGNVDSGLFTALSSGTDPAFYSSPVDLDSREFAAVEIRMKVDRGGGAQLFWAGRSRGFSEPASARFELTADNEFHVYRLNLRECATWKSRIGALRLDPTDQKGASIVLDYIRFIP